MATPIKRIMAPQRPPSAVDRAPAPRGPGADALSAINKRREEITRVIETSVASESDLAGVASALGAANTAIGKCAALIAESTSQFEEAARDVKNQTGAMADAAAEQAVKVQKFATPQDRQRAKEAASRALVETALKAAGARVVASLRPRAVTLANDAAEKLGAVSPLIKRARVARRMPTALSESEERVARRLERQFRATPVAKRMQEALGMLVDAIEVDDMGTARVVADAGADMAADLTDGGVKKLKSTNVASAMRAGAATDEVRAAKEFLAIADNMRRRDQQSDALELAVACLEQLEALFRRTVGVDPADAELVSAGEFKKRYLSQNPQPYKTDDVLAGSSGADWLMRFAARKSPLKLLAWSVELPVLPMKVE